MSKERSKIRAAAKAEGASPSLARRIARKFAKIRAWLNRNSESADTDEYRNKADQLADYLAGGYSVA